MKKIRVMTCMLWLSMSMSTVIAQVLQVHPAEMSIDSLEKASYELLFDAKQGILLDGELIANPKVAKSLYEVFLSDRPKDKTPETFEQYLREKVALLIYAREHQWLQLPLFQFDLFFAKHVIAYRQAFDVLCERILQRDQSIISAKQQALVKNAKWHQYSIANFTNHASAQRMIQLLNQGMRFDKAFANVKSFAKQHHVEGFQTLRDYHVSGYLPSQPVPVKVRQVLEKLKVGQFSQTPILFSKDDFFIVQLHHVRQATDADLVQEKQFEAIGYARDQLRREFAASSFANMPVPLPEFLKVGSGFRLLGFTNGVFFQPEEQFASDVNKMYVYLSRFARYVDSLGGVNSSEYLEFEQSVLNLTLLESAQAYLDDLQEPRVTKEMLDQAIEQYQQAKIKQFTTTEYALKHLVFKDKERAETVLRKIKAGEKIEGFSSDVLDSVGSKPLSIFQQVPQYSLEAEYPEDYQKIERLAPGELSLSVLNSIFGFQVVQLVEKRVITPKPQTLNEAERAYIKKRIQRELGAARLRELSQKIHLVKPLNISSALNK